LLGVYFSSFVGKEKAGRGKSKLCRKRAERETCEGTGETEKKRRKKTKKKGKGERALFFFLGASPVHLSPESPVAAVPAPLRRPRPSR